MAGKSAKKRKTKRDQARTRSRKYNAKKRQEQRARSAGGNRSAGGARPANVSRSAGGARPANVSRSAGGGKRPSNKRRKVSSKKRRRRRLFFILLLLIIIVAGSVFLFKKFDSDRSEQQTADKEKVKKEKIHLPENERASYFGDMLEGSDFNVIAGHPIDLAKAFTAYLEKNEATESADTESASTESADTDNEKDNSEKKNSEKDISDIISLKVTGDYDQNDPGAYEIKVKITDRANETETVNINLGVKDLADEKDDYSFITEKGFIGQHRKGITTIDGIKIANKTYPLPKKYGKELTRKAFEAFEQMAAKASDEGIYLYIKSDYRPYKDQKIVYDGYVKKHGREEADKYSARPGYSEHQLGECIDINYTDESFANTPAGQWVNKNCSKYGYIIRYPEGKANESMYIYEPWHLRYVGKKLAKKLYNKGDWITLEDYFGIDSRYEDE